MTQEKLNPEDERWLQEYLASLPEAFNFDFKRATYNLIEDQGFEWVKSHAGLLKSEADYVANL